MPARGEILAMLPLPDRRVSMVWSADEAHARELLALPPRTLDEIQVVLDARQLRRLFLAVVVCLPGLVAAAGLWVAWRRR